MMKKVAAIYSPPHSNKPIPLKLWNNHYQPLRGYKIKYALSKTFIEKIQSNKPELFHYDKD